MLRAKAEEQAVRALDLLDRLIADPDDDSRDAEYEQAIRELHATERAIAVAARGQDGQ
jgi:hypothetical protein